LKFIRDLEFEIWNFCHIALCALFQGLLTRDDINYGLRFTIYDFEVLKTIIFTK